MDIFASKFYKTSPRKDKILAAMNDPVNLELVTQLKSYLDPEDAKELRDNQPSVKSVEPSHDDNSTGSTSSAPPPLNEHSGSPSPMTDEILDDFDEGEPTALDDPALDDQETKIDKPDIEDVEEVEPVASATSTDVDPKIKATPSSSIIISDIKDALSDNSIENVSRVAVRHGNEAWIYFEDDVNLNSVMDSVIDVLEDKSSSDNYSSMQFNRLARSNNAIVFEFTSVSPIKTVDEVDIDVNTTREE